MKANLGKWDRTIRVTVSAIIAVLYFSDVLKGTIGTILLIIAVPLLITSLIGACPFYCPFGLSTGKGKATDQE